jgi:hypothetical protein
VATLPATLFASIFKPQHLSRVYPDAFLTFNPQNYFKLKIFKLD